MAIRRGVFYRVPTFSKALGLLVLTSDQWNEAPTVAAGLREALELR